MTSIKKTLAILLTLAVLSVAVIVPLSAFTGSTATMPKTLTLIEDFETGSDGWNAVGDAKFATSGDYGYGTSGYSLKVELASGWKGAKIQSCTHEIVNDGIAFWIYLPQSIDSGKNFVVALRVGTKKGDTATKYEAKVPVSDLTAGEHVITIPWTDFAKHKDSTASTPIISGNYITQLEFTSNAGSGIYYLDQLGMYKNEGIQPNFTPSTVKMPESYKVIDDFNKASSLSWAANRSTAELSTDRGYGTAGMSMHVTWSESNWCGFKTSSNQSITLRDDGLAFWAYNAGSELTNFAIILLQGDARYEAKITLKAGEGVYRIPWTDFVYEGASVDTTKTVRQIEFTKSAPSADYYIDELSCYSRHIVSTLDMPKEFTVIDDFNGENTLAWAGTNKAEANFNFSEERGYGADGKSAHVSWTESVSGWSGFKTASGKNIALTGKGLAFWAYNAGSELTDFAVVLLQDGVKYEAKITLKAGEMVYKIPFADFVKNGTAVNTTKTVSQIEFTKFASSADYYIDHIGCYSNPKKPAVSTIVFDTSAKCSIAAVGGTGKGNSGGKDPVKWKLYDIENDPRFKRAGWFIADDVTAGVFRFSNVTNIGTLKAADISSAYDFGNLVFWVKSEVANRSLKVALRNIDSNKYSDYITFTVTEANKWQQVTIPIKDMLKTESILVDNPAFLKSIDAVAFTGQGFTNTFKLGETFKIAGLRIYDSDVPDYSKYANLDTEPTQLADDGSHPTDSKLIGRIAFEKDSYSGNSGYGTATKVEYTEFAETLKGVKIVAGKGIKDYGMGTKGLSIWFGNLGEELSTVDASNLEDGYFSMWVRSNRAGMSFYWVIMDDTDNDAKTTVVKTYTIKEANKWEEVRVRLTDVSAKGMLDLEYLTKLSIRTGYGAFNWRYAYTDEQWFNTGDTLEITAAMITDGKPINPFKTKMSDIIPSDEEDEGNNNNDNNNDNNDDTNNDVGTGDEGTGNEGAGDEGNATTPEGDGTENEGTTPDSDSTENEGTTPDTDGSDDANTDDGDDSGFNILPIVLGIIGGVLGLAVIIIIIAVILKKKRP